MCSGLDGNSEQSIVALCLPVFGLLGFDDSDDTRRYDTAGKDRRVHLDENVQRIAVLPAR